MDYFGPDEAMQESLSHPRGEANTKAHNSLRERVSFTVCETLDVRTCIICGWACSQVSIQGVS